MEQIKFSSLGGDFIYVYTLSYVVLYLFISILTSIESKCNKLHPFISQTVLH